MKDFRELLPHSKKDVKCDSRHLPLINEICEMKNCTSAIIFEARRKGDLYVWFSKTPAGPSIKFLARNVHTMRELKFTGNCLKGSRPIVCFDESFDSTPYYRIMKEVFKHVFPTPHYHPKSKPFIDHTINLYIHDDHIWFRNYQITGEHSEASTALVEIGPRFVLYPIKILSGSWYGTVLWENPKYMSPSALRGIRKLKTAQKHNLLIQNKKVSRVRHKELTPVPDPLEKLFNYDDRKLLRKFSHNKLSSNHEDMSEVGTEESDNTIEYNDINEHIDEDIDEDNDEDS